MLKLSRELNDYLNNYVEGLIKDSNKDNQLYLRVLNVSLELAKDENQLMELISFGNEFIMRHKNTAQYNKYFPQFKSNLKSNLIYYSHVTRTYKDPAIASGLNIGELPDPYLVYERKDMLEKVKDAFKELNPKQRTAVEDYYLKQMNFKEISQDIGCSTDRAKQYIGGGIRRICYELPVAYYRHVDDEFMTKLLEDAEKYREEKQKYTEYKNRTKSKK